MSAQEDKLSHQQKLQNARSTRGHRRTQSNSQYDFTQLQVTPQMTEQEKKNKEDFEKMIQINRIIDASSTVEALNAQKNNQEEKKTIVDCIEDDSQMQPPSTAGTSSMFNFGKNLQKKKRHNSDVGTLSRSGSSFIQPSLDLQKLNEDSQYRTKRVNGSDEEDEEADDDFDSMFFQKYKKFSYSNQFNGFPYPGFSDGLQAIPELANSSEFGTSINKDTQSLHSHKKSLANTTKILNTHPSNSSSTDFNCDQILLQKNPQNVPSSFLSSLNQQQSQQDMANQQILKQQLQEYEQAKQKYQMNQMLRQNQPLTQTNNQMSNKSNQNENNPDLIKQYQNQQLANPETSQQKNTQPQNQQILSTKITQQTMQQENNQLHKNQKSQSHSPLSGNNSNNPVNKNFNQQNILSFQQSTSPLSNNANPSIISPKSNSLASGQITKNISSSQSQQSQQVNPSLTSSSNISQYHHSRVESSQFSAQNNMNEFKDLNISKYSKRNSIHEIFNQASSITSQKGNIQNGLVFSVQQNEQKQQQQQNQQQSNTNNSLSGRGSNLSDSIRPLVQQFNLFMNEHERKEDQVPSSNSNDQGHHLLFPQKVNLLINKAFVDRKDVGKQRYQQNQNDSSEQHSMIDNISSPKENRQQITPSTSQIKGAQDNNQNQQISSFRQNISKVENQNNQQQNLSQQTYQNNNSSFNGQQKTNNNNLMSFSNQLNLQINNFNNVINSNDQKSQRRHNQNTESNSSTNYTHQTNQSISLNKQNQQQTVNNNQISNNTNNNQKSIFEKEIHQVQQNNYFQSNHSTNQQLNTSRNLPKEGDSTQRKVSFHNNNMLVNSQNIGNSTASSNSKSSNNILNSSNNISNPQQVINIHNSSQLNYPNQQQFQGISQTMSIEQSQQLQKQLQFQMMQQQQPGQQFNQQLTIDSDQQRKTYSQIIKDYLKGNGNSFKLGSNTQNTNSVQISKCNSNQNTLQKSSNTISREQKPKNSSISTNPLSAKSTQSNQLEGRVFMLESKVLSLKQKTDSLEKVNQNLTHELIKIKEEKANYIKENLESKQRIIELETVTKKNEESISVILQMLHKSQSDYELLLRQQKQEVSTNIFTDISCIDSPNEILNQKVQKQVLLQNKNMNQIIDYCDQKSNQNKSYILRDKEQKFQNNCNITNSNSFAYNQKGSFVQQPQMTGNQNKYYNENYSFNSILQQKKQQQNGMSAKQNSQLQSNQQNINNILKPSNLNYQNQPRLSSFQ